VGRAGGAQSALPLSLRHQVGHHLGGARRPSVDIWDLFGTPKGPIWDLEEKNGKPQEKAWKLVDLWKNHWKNSG